MALIVEGDGGGSGVCVTTEELSGARVWMGGVLWAVVVEVECMTEMSSAS